MTRHSSDEDDREWGEYSVAGKGEYKTLNEINGLWRDKRKKAVATRLLQPKGTPQPCDIIVDSDYPELYCAVEVKYMGKLRNLLYGSDFSVAKDGGHQLDRIIKFCKLTGRKGYIVLYVKPKRKFIRYVFPAEVLWAHWKTGATGVDKSAYDTWNVEDDIPLFGKKRLGGKRRWSKNN